MNVNAEIAKAKANAERGIRNSEWMTVRLGDVVEVNPKGGGPEI